MMDGNVLLRQERDEVPEGTLSCPDRNMEVFNQLSHYEGLRLLPSVCGWKLIQQTRINSQVQSHIFVTVTMLHLCWNHNSCYLVGTA